MSLSREVFNPPATPVALAYIQTVGVHRREIERGSREKLPPCRNGCCLGLRQIVAERGPDHIVDGMRGEAGGRTNTVAAGPSVAGEVRVLQTPLEPALFALVDFVPEAEGGFIDVPCVARASAAGSGCPCCRRWDFQSAAGVVGVGRTVSANSIGSNGRGC